MKNVAFLIWKFIRSYFLQTLLVLFALNSFDEARYFGNRILFKEGLFEKEVYSEHGFGKTANEEFPTSVAVSTGYNGGAIAMGLICSVCIVMIVWIEINKVDS